MRRAAIASLTLLGLTLTSCAAPVFNLRARFLPGEVREYRLVADATVRISAGRASTSERSRLLATTTIAVVGITGEGTTITLTLTPTALTRDGKAAQTPVAQQIRMTVAPDGRVTEVTGGGDQNAPLEASDIEDLVPLVGPPVPPGRVHLADRWSRSVAGPTPAPSATPSSGETPAPTGTEDARLAALRIVDGYDCAVIATSTRRPVVRERTVGGQPLRLEGVEFAAGEIVFAFREGFPVSVGSDSEARLGISGGSAQGGAVVIETKTTLTLVRRSTP